WLCRRLGRPVRWIEDRREQLSAGANCREHHYDITLYADAGGRLLAIDCEATVDSGAYSSYPFSACLEAAQVGSILPGPYKMDRYRCRTWSVATNKAPILPYRGVARTGVCFALELMIDAAARELGIEPHEMRLANLVQPSEMPFNNITKKHFDSGDYPEAVRRAAAMIDVGAVRKLQQANSTEKRIGVGFAIYCEQAAHGTSVYYGWAFRWCRATSNARRASRRTACSSCASARTRTARAWRRRSRRWRIPFSGSIRRTSGSCTATPGSRPTPPAHGARAAW